MKKALTAVFVLALLAAAGMGIFLATFDADRYRPQAEKKLSDALGVPVSLGKLSVVWKGGFAVSAKELKVYRDASRKEAPVSAERVTAFVKAAPLLSKRVEVAAVAVERPSVDYDARRPFAFSLPAGKPGGAAGGSKPGAEVSVGKITVTGGRLRYRGAADGKPIEALVKSLDVTVSGFAPGKEARFEGRAAVFAKAQNLRFSGILAPSVLRDFRLSMNFEGISLPELFRAVPSLEEAGLRELETGSVTLETPSWPLDGFSPVETDADFLLQGVKASWGKWDVDGLHVKAGWRRGDVDPFETEAMVAGGRVKMAGKALRLFSAPRYEGKLSAERLDLLRLVPSRPGAPALSGKLSAQFAGSAAGLTGPALLSTLDGAGDVFLEEPVLKGANLPRAIVGALAAVPGKLADFASVLPGAVSPGQGFINDARAAASYLENGLHPAYRSKLAQPDTPFGPLKLRFTVEQGTLRPEPFLISSELFALRGGAIVALDGFRWDTGATLFVERGFSAALSAPMQDLALLANPGGEIEVPFSASGEGAKLTSFRPDTRAIGNRIGPELVGRLISKGLAARSGGTTQAAGSSSQAQPSFEDILGGLLQK